jgi:hypothetical protein
VLDRLLSSDRFLDVIKIFEVDKAFQPVALRESFDNALTMLKRPAWQIARDAGVKNAIASIGHEIEPAALHVLTKGSRGWPGQARP